jgi:hypothetical protein
MSYQDELPELINQLKASGVEFDAGLSDAEVTDIEQTCNFQFPPDLKMFLQLGMPLRWRYKDRVDDRFPNWREDPLSIMNRSQEDIIGAFHFDIQHSNFWMERWGNRPTELEEAFAVVDRFFETVPILIPIYIHRLIPAQPQLTGNPVFSVWQAIDTIYYGYNLQNYLAREFVRGQFENWGQASDYRYIPFWSDLVARGGRRTNP